MKVFLVMQHTFVVHLKWRESLMKESFPSYTNKKFRHFNIKFTECQMS